MRLNILSLIVMLLLPAVSMAGELTLQSHKPGIWEIQGTDSLDRWIVIHNRDDAAKSGIYHIEVIGRAKGDPLWNITRIRSHMAITKAALKRSVFKPMETGAVYPEPFNDAFRKWTLLKEKGEAKVCDRSVVECLEK